MTPHPCKTHHSFPVKIQGNCTQSESYSSKLINVSGNNVDVFFNGDLENPTRINAGGNQTFNKWIKHYTSS